jgi:branched-subunit amino acid aminotransferase/4-amino-4-deoxychorismate lyase
MIWVDGRIVPDDALKVSVLDRTFEHGLGLFETLRTFNGRAPLLDRHLARMTRSARELDLPIDLVKLPDQRAIEALLDAEQADGDCALRITLSGGLGPDLGPTLWMRTRPILRTAPETGAVISLGPWEVAHTDPLARHKTLNYWPRRRAFEAAQRLGFDEVLCATLPGPRFWEGSRTNLFVVKRDALITPSLEGPVLPGVMRGLVLELARANGWTVREEAGVSPARLGEADEVFLTNSVRGIIPVAKAQGNGYPGLGPWIWDAPGPWTQRLAILVRDRLQAGGEAT